MSDKETQTWAIINKRTGKFVYGTDFRYSPRRQRTSLYKAILYDFRFDAEVDFERRRCGKDYKIVPVQITILEVENKVS